jgi:hypothetical protein
MGASSLAASCACANAEPEAGDDLTGPLHRSRDRGGLAFEPPGQGVQQRTLAFALARRKHLLEGGVDLLRAALGQAQGLGQATRERQRVFGVEPEPGAILAQTDRRSIFVEEVTRHLSVGVEELPKSAGLRGGLAGLELFVGPQRPLQVPDHRLVEAELFAGTNASVLLHQLDHRRGDHAVAQPGQVGRVDVQVHALLALSDHHALEHLDVAGDRLEPLQLSGAQALIFALRLQRPVDRQHQRKLIGAFGTTVFAVDALQRLHQGLGRLLQALVPGLNAQDATDLGGDRLGGDQLPADRVGLGLGFFTFGARGGGR